MKRGVRITAKVTAGLGCIKGDSKVYPNVHYIEDRESYWNLVIHNNRQVRVAKDYWKIERV